MCADLPDCIDSLIYIQLANLSKNLNEEQKLQINLIMSSVTFSQKTTNPQPPDKGSFPLDHENVCKIPMIAFFKCLGENNFMNEKCREFSKEYLKCRMDNGLMAQENWDTLGFKDLDKGQDEK